MSTPSPYAADLFKNRPIDLAFLPKRLSIKGRAELSDFPKHVIFGATPVSDLGPGSIALSVYIPHFETYEEKSGQRLLVYRNYLRPQNAVAIVYDPADGTYFGKKMVNGKTVASVVGFSWDDFFARFSLAGMTNGDRCVRHKLDHDQITGADIEKIVETYERVSLEIEKDHATPSEELVESDKAS